MGLVSRISGIDTWSELERAADERYWDGIVLAVDREGRHSGAVYCWGYVVEMKLKTAYYRVRGVPSSTDLQTELRGIPDRARALGLAWVGSLHNLVSLVSLLIIERRIRGQPLNSGLAQELRRHIAIVGDHWTETLRYKDTRATPEESSEVMNSVDWLLAHAHELWN
jgi:hypothetical protein